VVGEGGVWMLGVGGRGVGGWVRVGGVGGGRGFGSLFFGGGGGGAGRGLGFCFFWRCEAGEYLGVGGGVGFAMGGGVRGGSFLGGGLRRVHWEGGRGEGVWFWAGGGGGRVVLGAARGRGGGRFYWGDPFCFPGHFCFFAARIIIVSFPCLVQVGLLIPAP